VWRDGASEREPLLVDESVTIEESWALAKRYNRMESLNSASPEHTTRGQRVEAWLSRIEPSRPWAVAAVVFIASFVLAGLAMALLTGGR
jgi:hypothetical protein